MDSSERLNILLVDDTPANLLALEAVLEGLGENLVRAASGEEALRQAAERDFALILLDVRMPGIDGLETARRIRRTERGGTTPILLLTARDTTARELAEAYAAGAADYLSRPFAPEILKAKIGTFVELARKTAQLRREVAQREDAEREVRRLNEDLERRVRERTAQVEAAQREREQVLRLHQDGEARLTLLTEAADTLLGSLDSAVVVPAILSLARRLLEADSYALWRQDPESGGWRIAADLNLSPGYPRSAPPNGEALPEQAAVIEDVERDPRAARRLEIFRAEGVRAVLYAPLLLHGRRSGTITFYFRQPHRYDPLEIRVAGALANLAAAAITTAELYEEQSRMRRLAETARRRLSFLAEASAVLASSLDYEMTLKHVARLVVPHLADWCTVHLLREDGGVRQVAMTHADPEKLRWAQALQQGHAYDPGAERGLPNVLRTGRPELYREITDEMLAQVARDPEHLEVLRQVGFTAVLIVPLRVRDRTVGGITFTSAESGIRYDESDLELAEDLAGRAAVAIENARLYREARQALAELRSSEEHKDQFLSMLGHELRNPLAAVSSALHVMELSGADTPAYQRARSIAVRQVVHQTRLVDDLLDVSRINQGKVPLRPEPVDLARLVRDTAEDYRGAVDRAGLTLELELPDAPVLLNGDPTRLAQVVSNLLDNAVKFTAAGGQLQLSIELEGRPAVRSAERTAGRPSNSEAMAILRVRDTGIGIAPDLLPLLFEPFRQADASLDRSRGGLGLGLALVRGLVELHGGAVQARSEGAGKGSEFVVRFRS